MPAGLQVWGDHGLLQIDGENRHVTLARNGSTASRTVAGVAVSYSGCSIPMNPGDLLAIDCEVPFAVVGKRAGSWDIVILGGVGTPVNWWVFAPHAPSGINAGMEIYDGNGALIYDTGRAPIRVCGTVEGSGTAGGFVPGRRYALVVWQQRVSLVREMLLLGGGVTPVPDYMLAVKVSSGFARSQGDGTIRVTDAEYFMEATGPWSAGSSTTGYPVNWEGAWDNMLDNKYSVIDVTAL